MLEDGLHQTSNGLQEPLAWIHQAVLVGKGSGTRDGNAGIEAAASRLYVVEALGQRHLCCMNIGTVGKHLDTHSCRELGGQALACEGATGDGLSRLSKQQRE